MTQLSNAYDYDTSNEARESLSDVVYNVSRDDTPLISRIERVNVTQPIHEWHVQDIPTDTTPSFVPEGDAFSASSVTAPSRLSNACGILKKEYTIAETMMATSVVGANVEEREEIINAKALRNELEITLLDNNAKVTSGIREIGGLPTYLTSNTNFNDDGTAADPSGNSADARTDAASTHDFSESKLTDVMQSIATNSNQGSGRFMLLTRPNTRQKISEVLSGGNTRFQTREDGSINGSVDVYISSFGEIEVFHTNHCRKRDLFVLKPDFLALGVLRDFGRRDLGRRGDGEDYLINVEATLEVRSEKAHGIITDLTEAA